LTPILFNLGIIVITSVVIMYACDSFELASKKLGETFPKGIRGATINAVGSSLPELFTSFFLLFLYHNKDGFSGGVATCAGSAIFNAVIIPALCIITVVFFGVRVNGKLEKIDAITLEKSGVMRDGAFFIFCCILLIFMLSSKVLYWWMGAVLVFIYTLYVMYIYAEFKRGRIEVDEDDDEDEEEIEDPPSTIGALLTLNFHWLLYRGKSISRGQAWVLLLLGVIFIALPCHFLAEACIKLAEHTGIPVFFTAVILAAAATSVPDTIISIRDARGGDYDDAVSNAFGSNIFDITICLGLPLMLYGLIYGNVEVVGVAGATGSSGGSAAVQELQIILFLITVIVFAIFLIGRGLGKAKAVMLFSIYGLFIVYCVGRINKWPWLQSGIDFLRGVFQA